MVLRFLQIEKSKCCVIVLVILRCLGLRKANVRYCSSDFKVFGLEKSKCASCSSDFKVLAD